MFCRVHVVSGRWLQRIVLGSTIIATILVFTGKIVISPVHHIFMNEHTDIPCQIPTIDPFDSSIAKFFWKPEPLMCDSTPSIVYVNNSNVLVVNISALQFFGIRNYSEVVCDVRPVRRFPDDNTIEFSKTTRGTPPLTLTSDFSHVSCKALGDNIVFDNIVAGVNKLDENIVGNFGTESERYPSVIMLGVDSVSRSASVRYLPKTRQYLEEIGAYDFKGLMKVGDNTLPNLVALLMGKMANKEEYLDLSSGGVDDLPFLWKNYSFHNYVTLFAGDWPLSPPTFYNKFYRDGFSQQPTNHYMRPYWLALKKRELLLYKLYKSLEGSIVTAGCNQNTPKHVITLNYIRHFLLCYRQKQKFIFAFQAQLAHDVVNYLHYADEDFVSLFKWMKLDGLLDNAILVFFSDHGTRYNNIRNTYIGRIESRMPLLSIVIPEALKRKYPDIDTKFRHNTERLVTHLDIYQTMIDISEQRFGTPSIQVHKGKPRAYSLLRKIPENRSCVDAWISESFCTCYIDTESDISVDSVVQHISIAIVNHINELILTDPRCQRLSLSKVVSARVMSLGLKHTGSEISFSFYQFVKPEETRKRYVITLETVPGLALFDVTCEYSATSGLHILGHIDRTNMYGNQSACVSSVSLKQYCYC